MKKASQETSGTMMFPRDTGHRVKDHIMIINQNEVLDEMTTEKPRSGIQAGSGGIGCGSRLQAINRILTAQSLDDAASQSNEFDMRDWADDLEMSGRYSRVLN